MSNEIEKLLQGRKNPGPPKAPQKDIHTDEIGQKKRGRCKTPQMYRKVLFILQ